MWIDLAVGFWLLINGRLLKEEGPLTVVQTRLVGATLAALAGGSFVVPPQYIWILKGFAGAVFVGFCILIIWDGRLKRKDKSE